ncbi:MAG: acyloxyacyl hydrolase [Solitalea sp.]
MKFIRISGTLCTLLWLQAALVYGQQSPAYSLSFSPAIGAHILPENDRALNDLIVGADLTYGMSLQNRRDPWIERLNAREFGISLFFRDLNRLDGHLDTSANSFGKAYGAAISLDFQLAKAGPVTFHFIPSAGIAYITKNYFTHPDNRFIGSHLNQMLKAALQLEVPLGETFDLLANVHVLHLSNGGFNIPNSGINSGNVSLGVKSRFKTENAREPRRVFRQLDRNTVELAAGIGRRGVYQRRRGIARAGFYGGYNYRLNEVIDLRGGLNAAYYGTVFDPQRRNETYQHFGSSYDPWRLGLSLGVGVKMSRVEVRGMAGRYLHFNSLHDISYYWNAGGTFFLSPHWGVQSTLHMHRFQADFVDLGLAVKI